MQLWRRNTCTPTPNRPSERFIETVQYMIDGQPLTTPSSHSRNDPDYVTPRSTLSHGRSSPDISGRAAPFLNGEGKREESWAEDGGSISTRKEKMDFARRPSRGKSFLDWYMLPPQIVVRKQDAAVARRIFQSKYDLINCSTADHNHIKIYAALTKRKENTC